MRRPLYSPGLQPERTRLAWRRTLLTLAVGALVAFRFLPATLGVWSLLIGFLAWGVLWQLASLRAQFLIRHNEQPLTRNDVALLRPLQQIGELIHTKARSETRSIESPDVSDFQEPEIRLFSSVKRGLASLV